MATSKYSDIEIQTAKNLLKDGYKWKWIARDESGCLFAYTDKPSKLDTYWCSDGMCNCVCYYVPIFQNIRFEDKEPVSLEAIVHPQILDDAEKRYLSAVIKPFRKHVQNIAKYRTFGNTEEYIIIQIDSPERLSFPHFKVDTMYIGMEPGRRYTLEELGL